MAKDWDLFKDDIRTLYMERKKTLAEVMRLMKQNRNFHASERAYRIRLQKWGYTKYNTENSVVHGSKHRRGAQTGKYPHRDVVSNVAGSKSPAKDHFSFVDPQSINAVQQPQTYSHNKNTFCFNPDSPNSSGIINDHLPYDPRPRISHTTRYGNDLSLNAQDSEGKTRLHRAVINGVEASVGTMLSSGSSVDIMDNAGNQPLHYAVLRRFPHIVELLLTFSADINSKGQHGRSPLHMAVTCEEIFRLLLNSGAITTCQDDKGCTPLHLALSPQTQVLPDLGVAELLLHAPLDLNVRNHLGITPFHMLLHQAHLRSHPRYFSLLRICLESGADITLPISGNKAPFEIFLDIYDEISAAFSVAIWSGPDVYDCLRLFLSKGADPNTKVRSGELLFHHYLQHHFFTEPVDSPGILHILCEKVDHRKIGKNGNYTLHQLSVAAGLRDMWFNTPMAKYIEIALNNGANPNQLNRSGNSPLMILLSKNSLNGEELEAVDVLLAANANPTLGSPSGNFLLYEAIKRPPMQLGKKLLQADVKYRLEGHENCRHERAESPDHPWWQKWKAAIVKNNWDDAKAWLRNSPGILPPDGNGQINIIALSVLAGRYFEMAKDDFKRDKVGRAEHRSYLAEILRDCRDFRIDVDSECYSYLFDLCKK